MNLIIISVPFYFSTISGKAVQRKSRAIGVGLSNDRTSLYAALGKRTAFLRRDETNNWIGKKIVLASEMVDFRGEPTWAIRVKQAADFEPAPKTKPAPKGMSGGGGFSDDILF
jgi:hypothetical protein